jgi:hypothetical protein
MLTDIEYKKIKNYDKLFVCDNLCEIMNDNWNYDMIYTKNKIGKVLGIDNNGLIILQFEELKYKSREYFYYDRRCLSTKLPAYMLYKPRKKLQI